MLKYKITFPQDVVFYVEEELFEYMSNLEKLTKDKLNNTCKDIMVGHIEGETFSHILMYVRHLATYPNDTKFRENLIKNMETDILFNVIIAADYFGVHEITEYCGNMFKNIIDSNDIDGIKSIFNIKDNEE